MGRRATLLVALTLTLAVAACSARPGSAPGATLTRADLDAAHARLARARADLRARPFAARLVAILVEPFGSQRNANVQSFFNVEAAALWACAAAAPAPAALDVVVAYDARAIVDLAAFGADRVRLPDVEACLRARFAASPLARPVAPGRLLFVAAALAPGADALAPGADALAPGADALAPGADALAPGADALAPGADALAPGADALAPGADALAPTTAPASR